MIQYYFSELEKLIQTRSSIARTIPDAELQVLFLLGKLKESYKVAESTDTNNTNYLHTNTNFKIGISCLSILVAIMSGLQKYCKYAERTEITKNYAKNFEILRCDATP